MTTSKQCSTCQKPTGIMHCTGCDAHFCSKDFRTHRDTLFKEMDKIVEERNVLQAKISQTTQTSDSRHPLIEQIDEWEKTTIRKVQETAEQTREQVHKALSSKRVKITNEFKSFSQKLADLKETEDFVEHDLARLKQMIQQLHQDLQKLNQPVTIELCTEQSDQIQWNNLIYVRDIKIQEFAPPGTYEALDCKGRHCAECGKCRDWYYTGDSASWKWIRDCKNWQEEDRKRYNNDKVYERFKKRDGATCDHYLLHLGHFCLCADNVKSG